MPAPLANSFEGGADGVALTDGIGGNTGGASGDYFFVNGTALAFTNVQAHKSALSMRGVDLAGANSVEWQGLGSLTTQVFFRWYVYLSAYPTGNRHYMVRVNTSAGAQSTAFRIMSDATGHFGVADSAGSGTGQESVAAVSLNQWVRIETRVATGTGACDWKFYNNPESMTETENFIGLTGLSLGANIDRVQWGMPLTPVPTTPYTFHMDDLAVSTVDWIGPRADSVTSTFESPHRRFGPF